ncbi:hypothetical protein [Parvibaculum sp.]|uniref:hypothetical protein n=1 Tax=Parvibaculum sp. TaxID=2024848 RepID=UPI001D9AE4EC|nr:hypothetical protein [Parvibaculum sp.]MBX3489307.1 hypothetical protein [Parvibaculum sp.]MCW5726737.1 hypothetical protein [Parvibaculum sp.]
MTGLLSIYIRLALVLVVASALGGCGTKWIAFHERSQLALSSEVSNPTSTPQPLELSVAYKRVVYAIVPNKGPSGDAKNLVSRMATGYDSKGNLVLKNGFASGPAAVALSKSTRASAALLGSTSDVQETSPDLDVEIENGAEDVAPIE